MDICILGEHQASNIGKIFRAKITVKRFHKFHQNGLFLRSMEFRFLLKITEHVSFFGYFKVGTKHLSLAAGITEVVLWKSERFVF